jgi:hypothetical protein
MTATAPETPQARPFAAVLADLRHGAVLDLAAAELVALVAAVTETGKKGKLVLTVDVGPMKGNPDALTVGASVKTTPPTPEHEAVFFADKHSNLVRDDPRQAALPGLRIAGGNVYDTPKDAQ